MCYIRNKVNNEDSVVGNCCINHFIGKDLKSVFRALRNNKINPALLFYTHEAKIITKWEYDFMMDVWRKRKFTYKQRRVYNQIKKKIYDACKALFKRE